jgi:hypothetical protein
MCGTCAACASDLIRDGDVVFLNDNHQSRFPILKAAIKRHRFGHANISAVEIAEMEGAKPVAAPDPIQEALATWQKSAPQNGADGLGAAAEPVAIQVESGSQESGAAIEQKPTSNFSNDLRTRRADGSALLFNVPDGIQLLDGGNVLIAFAQSGAAMSELRRRLSMPLPDDHREIARMPDPRQNLRGLEALWRRMQAKIGERRPLIVSWLQPAQPISLVDGILMLRFPADQSIALESLARPNNKRILDEIASAVLGTETRIDFSIEQ